MSGFDFSVPNQTEITEVDTQAVFAEIETTELERKIANNDTTPIISNLNFNFASETLVEESLVEVDEIIEVLRKYEGLTLEIRAHTDCRGSDAYNLTLSEKRANYIKDYLIANGNIDQSRIEAKGYGESLPLVECDCTKGCSDAEHFLNRRSEFTLKY